MRNCLSQSLIEVVSSEQSNGNRAYRNVRPRNIAKVATREAPHSSQRSRYLIALNEGNEPLTSLVKRATSFR
jgi:hypothetical protein